MCDLQSLRQVALCDSVIEGPAALSRADPIRRRARFSCRDYLMLVVAFLVLFAAIWIEALWRLAIAALLWAPVVFCAVAAMHWTASLHLRDPLAPLYAFVACATVARAVLRIGAGYVRKRMI